MRDRLPHSVLIWWQQYFELKLTTHHEKWEYYVAALRNDMKSIMDGESRNINEGLIKFESQTEEEELDKQIQENEAFMSVLTGFAKSQKR